MFRSVEVLLVTLLCSSAITARAQTPPTDGRSSVFVGSATLARGVRTPLDLVVRLDAGHDLDEFAISLSFDPKLVTVTDFALDPAWIAAETGAPIPPSGQLLLSGLHSTGSCRAGSSCHLGTITVTGSGSGETLIELPHVMLFAGGVALPEPTVSPGRLQLGGVGPGSAASGSVTGVRDGGTGTNTQPQAGGFRPNSDSSLAAGLGVFILLAALLVGGCTFIVVLARKGWRWSAPHKGSDSEVAPAFQPDAASITEEFSEYLNRVEAFGRVVGKGADEAMVRDVATAFANNPPHRAKPIDRGDLPENRTLER